MVAAYEPLPTDNVVITRIGGARAFVPIDRYRSAVREAVEAADHMEAPIDVVPMGVGEFVQLKAGVSLADLANRSS